MFQIATRNLTAILLSVCALIGLTGCDVINDAPASPPTATPGREITVGLLLSSLNNPLYVSIQNGAIEAASRMHVSLLIRDAGNSSDRQVEQFEELLQLGIDAIVVNAVDANALLGVMAEAANRNVPVFTVEREVSSNAVVSHIASDNVVGGQMAAAFVVERLGRRGNVAELVGSAGVSVARDRGSGFNRFLAEYPGVQVVARGVAHFTRDEGRQIFAQMLSTHERIDAVFAHNDEMILGAIDAAVEAGRADEIVFVGFGAVSSAVDAIEAGQLTATIAQQPSEMGRLSVETVVEYLNREPTEERVLVDLALITR